MRHLSMLVLRQWKTPCHLKTFGLSSAYEISPRTLPHHSSKFVSKLRESLACGFLNFLVFNARAASPSEYVICEYTEWTTMANGCTMSKRVNPKSYAEIVGFSCAATGVTAKS